MTRPDAEPTASAPIVFQAPEGTFDNLISIAGGRLGNAYTRRFVRVMRMPNVFPAVLVNSNLKDDMAVVSVRIKTLKGEGVDDYHFLGIDPVNKIVVLESWRTIRYSGQHTLMETPDVQTLLNEIKIAQKLQSTLKR